MVTWRGNPIEIWSKLAEEYPLCSKLAKALLILPYSTCSVERVFSSMRDFRTPKRSRLTTENLEACLLSYQAWHSEDVKITQGMLNRYADIWKKAKVQDVSTVKHVDQLHKISEKVASEEQKYVRVGEDEEENKVEDPKEKSESQKMMKMESLLLELSIEEGPQRTSEEEMEWSEGKEEEDSSERRKFIKLKVRASKERQNLV